MEEARSVVHKGYMAREGDALARGLNQNQAPRIAQWLEYFQAQRRVAQYLQDVGGKEGLPELKPQRRPPTSFTVRFRLQPFIGPDGKQDCRVYSTTGYAAELLLRLIDADQAHRLRRCQHCSRWYFARREGQRFCRVTCRVKAHISLEPVQVRRRKRTEYMRDYRARQKESERKAFEQAKKIRREKR